MLYLIQCEIERQEYMADDAEYVDDIRLVEAVSLKEAIEKYDKFWQDKSQDYGTMYNTGTVSVSEMIY